MTVLREAAGRRWIVATSLVSHRRPDCPVLKAQRTRVGWRPFLVDETHDPAFYGECGRCR